MTKHPERSDRLRIFFNHLNIKNKDVASKLGIKPAFVSQLLNKHSTVTADVAMRIEFIYPTLNVKWLLNGEGEMLHESPIVPVGTLDPQVMEGDAVYGVGKEGVLEGLVRRMGELEMRVLELEEEVKRLGGENEGEGGES